jgi:hypothetical protein
MTPLTRFAIRFGKTTFGKYGSCGNLKRHDHLMKTQTSPVPHLQYTYTFRVNIRLLNSFWKNRKQQLKLIGMHLQELKPQLLTTCTLT